ncbi:MAG TPA: thiamine pyrophosphate-dependent enzyme, partial [Spirochaetota bacterium]|nr:thiamine pyrophosphate-dependent enzyme [Spirochaetota bacterium]
GRETDQYRFLDTNFAKLAEDMGALGIRVKKPDEVGNAIRLALESNRPAVVDVVTEPESFPILT